MKRRILSLFLALVAVVTLVGCKKTTTQMDLSGTYTIKVWAADAATGLFEQQIAKFNETNDRGIVIEATVEATGEGDAAAAMINDVDNGADLYCFPQDQLARLKEAQALQQLGNAATNWVKENNDGGAVLAATIANKLYAYPMTSDNGYFMYYDKSVITNAEHLKSLESLIADCEAAGKMFSFELEGSGWYNAAFFFATGCHANFILNDEGTVIDIDDTYNTPEGVIAMKGMQKLLTSRCYNNSSNAPASFSASTPSAIVVSGTWDAPKTKEALGANYGVAELPSFTVDGKSYHLGSMSGNKLIGLKPQEDVTKAAALNLLAQYLTSAECQEQRFDTLEWGPSNKTVQAMDKVKANEALAALAAQNEYAQPQGQYPGQWWDLTKALATAARNAKTDAEISTALKGYKDAIDALLNKVPASPTNGPWGVIGGGVLGNWDADHTMSKQTDGTFLSDQTFDFAAGTEFKVRLDGDWNKAIGNAEGGNFVVETAGKYRVKLTVTSSDPLAGTIELVPVEE
ncbi:MAG: extracellular solute-binding protein [Gammaproteobacteria bacterium]|nr:extracellular solute-binding protein [Gammaproteobacteria bacterium]